MMLFAILAPFFVNFTPEVRSSYMSLGKCVEDRPMQTIFARVGYDGGAFGRFGLYNFDVSSLTDRRHDAHRHLFYHTEGGPFWDYDIRLTDSVTLCNGTILAVTLYRGFENDASNGDYGWLQLGQSLENPYVVPYYRVRWYTLDTSYFYFIFGVRRCFPFWERFYVTPSVFAEGGNSDNYARVIGANAKEYDWGAGGVSSLTCRLEGGYKLNSVTTIFLYVEQYEVVGSDARKANSESTYKCAGHNDWTSGGVGLRFIF